MTFKEYPQRQKAASFNLDEVMEKLRNSSQSVRQPRRWRSAAGRLPRVRSRLRSRLGGVLGGSGPAC